MSNKPFVYNNCKDCAFFRFRRGNGGLCYRYPPTPIYQTILDGTGVTHGENRRPWVEGDEFCGEWTVRA